MNEKNIKDAFISKPKQNESLKKLVINLNLRSINYSKIKKQNRKKIEIITPNSEFTINDLKSLNPDINENTLRVYVTKHAANGKYKLVKKQKASRRSLNVYINAESTDVEKMLMGAYTSKVKVPQYITYD